MNKTKYRIFIGLIWMFAVGSVLGAETVYDVRDYGAKADGKTLCTTAIQKAIDKCANDGGGTVYLSPGTFKNLPYLLVLSVQNCIVPAAEQPSQKH